VIIKWGVTEKLLKIFLPIPLPPHKQKSSHHQKNKKHPHHNRQVEKRMLEDDLNVLRLSRIKDAPGQINSIAQRRNM
jgi:hypothetical protein